MCRSILFALCALLALPLGARAQLSVQLSMGRDTLVLYESVFVTATVRNFSGRAIDLAGRENAPWLGFLIYDETGASISQVGKPPLLEAVRVAPGETVSHTVNLLPDYDLRQRGTYTVRAVVESGRTHALSPPFKFTVLNGRELWRQTAGIPMSTGETNEEYRTYSMVTLHAGHGELLFVGVQDEERGLVHGMISLGEALVSSELSGKIDAAGHAHVLYRTGPRSYSYAEIDPAATVLQRSVYSDLLSVPRLITGDNGSVVVQGGEQTYPRIERVMTDAEVNPPTVPLEKPRKKKWWWPFGGEKSGAASATNAPAAKVHQ